jgi:hypothetical protein
VAVKGRFGGSARGGECRTSDASGHVQVRQRQRLHLICRSEPLSEDETNNRFSEWMGELYGVEFPGGVYTFEKSEF